MYVVTAPLDGPDTILPMRAASPQDFREESEGKLRSQRLRDLPFTIDAGGYVHEAMAEPGTKLVAAAVRLYRSGVFEHGWRFSKEDWRTIPSRALLEHAHDALLYFARVYAQVGYHGRIRTFIGIDNADEGVFAVAQDLADPEAWFTEQALAEDLRSPDDTNVDSLLQDPLPVVHRAMDYRIVTGNGACSLRRNDRTPALAGVP